MDIKKKKILIHFEEITISNLLTEYIYDGLFTLLSEIVLSEVNICTLTLDKSPNARYPNFITLILGLIEDLIEVDDANKRFPVLEFDKFLSALSVTSGFEN